MKKTRLVALGLGALSIAGLVGAGVGLSANNNVRADEVRADEPAWVDGTDLYFRASNHSSWAISDSLKMAYDADTKTYSIKNVTVSADEQFKIASNDWAHAWGGDQLNTSAGVTKSFFRKAAYSDNNCECILAGTYDFTLNLNIHKITATFSSHTYLLSNRSGMTNAYVFNSGDDDLREWNFALTLEEVGGSRIEGLSYFESSNQFYVYKVGTPVLDRYKYCILKNDTEKDSGYYRGESNTGDALGVIKANGEIELGLLDNKTSGLYEAINFGELVTNYMGSDDGLSKSICAAENNGGAEAIVEAYSHLSPAATTIISSNTLKINTYTRDSIEDPFTEETKGEVSLQNIYETALALDNKNKGKPSGVNVVSDNVIDAQALTVAAASVVAGVGVASGLIIIRKRKLN